MTDEQLVAYLDAAQSRLADAAIDEQIRWASAARVSQASRGDFTRWVSRLQRKYSGAPPSLSGARLEAAVMSLARSNPEYVVAG